MGPLFYFELVRLARRGRTTVLRCAYALALLLALFLAYRDRFPGHGPGSNSFKPALPLSVQEMSRLAEDFVYVILWVQTVAVFVLTPVYLGSAVAGERERGTLDLLRTTDLTAREIVFGKLFARAAHLGGILLAGLPLLALTQLWGGVDFRLLLAAFVATGLNLLSVGAVCIAFSAIFRQATRAIFLSYGLTLIQLVICTGLAASPTGIFRSLSVELAGPDPRLPPEPAHWLFAGSGVWPALATCVVQNGFLILVFTSFATASFLGRPDGITRLEDKPVILHGSRGRRVVYVLDDDPPPRRRPRPLPPVGGWPLLWKDKSRGIEESAAVWLERQFSKAPLPALLVPALLGAALFGWCRMTSDYPAVTRVVTDAARVAMLLSAGLWCVIVAFRAAGCISRERDSRTLDVLLTLPVSRACFVGSKWLGAVLGGRVFGYMLVFLVVTGLLGGVFHPLGVVLLTLMVASQVALLAGLGVWLSLVSRNLLRARVAMALALLVLAGGLTMTVPVLELTPRGSWQALAAEVGTDAPGTWWFLTFTWQDFASARARGGGPFATHLVVTATGILFFASLAGLFWLGTWRRLETGRVS